MHVDLFDLQAPGHGQPQPFAGPDGRIYTRRTTKTDRRTCDALIESGVPLVIYFYSRNQFEWADASEAQHLWMDLRPYLLTREPTAKELRRHEFWTAGIWKADDEHCVVYLTGQC